jgi:hypothetical protein
MGRGSLSSSLRACAVTEMSLLDPCASHGRLRNSHLTWRAGKVCWGCVSVWGVCDKQRARSLWTRSGLVACSPASTQSKLSCRQSKTTPTQAALGAHAHQTSPCTRPRHLCVLTTVMHGNGSKGGIRS